MTNSSILKLPGAFHCVNTSRIRFCAFSYSAGDPCGRSNQLSMYFIGILLDAVDVVGIGDEPTAVGSVNQGKPGSDHSSAPPGVRLRTFVRPRFVDNRVQTRIR